MRWLSRSLTIMSVIATLVGLTWYAIAASCTDVLPGSDDIAGWHVMAKTTHSGSMGSKASYAVYDGATDEMKKRGIRYFARRVYKDDGKYLIVDVFRMAGESQAKSYFYKELKEFDKASPLNKYASIKDRAFVGTLHSLTYGVCQRRHYVCKVSISRASKLSDRRTARSFLTFMSRKLKPKEKSK